MQLFNWTARKFGLGLYLLFAMRSFGQRLGQDREVQEFVDIWPYFAAYLTSIASLATLVVLRRFGVIAPMYMTVAIALTAAFFAYRKVKASANMQLFQKLHDENDRIVSRIQPKYYIWLMIAYLLPFMALLVIPLKVAYYIVSFSNKLKGG